MIDLITDNLEAIRTLARTHGVRRLDLYGSAATGEFNPDTSNVNFIVDLGEYLPGTAFRYLDLIADLEDLLGYEVHMVTDSTIEDPILSEILAGQRATVYEASND